MKKITRRAFSVLLLAAMIIFGMTVYVLQYVDNSRDWALYFSRANSGSGGEIIDRSGTVLASFDATTSVFADDAATRIACYHVTGDYWNRSGTGALGTFWEDMQDYSIITGTTKNERKTLRLNVSQRNKTAIRFYQNVGFHFTNRSLSDERVMKKSIEVPKLV